VRSLSIYLVSAMVLIAGCTTAQKVDVGTEKAQVRQVLNEYQQVFENGDTTLFFRIMAHDSDMVNFGTDAAERWVGWNELKESTKQQMATFHNTSLVISDQVIHVAPTGNIAWFSEVGDLNTTVGDQPVEVRGMRVTGVLEKRAGEWLFVQIHHSVPVSGQAVEY
jgi:ketosteroid isomerase-like protein